MVTILTGKENTVPGLTIQKHGGFGDRPLMERWPVKKPDSIKDQYENCRSSVEAGISKLWMR